MRIFLFLPQRRHSKNDECQMATFKTPKSSLFIINIGVLNAKNKAFKMPKKKRFKCQKWCIRFMKWTPNLSISVSVTRTTSTSTFCSITDVRGTRTMWTPSSTTTTIKLFHTIRLGCFIIKDTKCNISS